MRETGTYQTLGALRYFIPHPLPPSPPFEMNAEIMSLYGEANFHLGKLNEIGERLPDIRQFIKAYVIKEALLSSAIENINTTLVDVFTCSLEYMKPNKDTQLVLNYTHALEVATELMKTKNLPLSSRILLAAHSALLTGGDGDAYAPGTYRQQSVRVGTLVPPPAGEVPRLMGELEKYINMPSDLSPLIKAGLAHVQFETIHPFLDGNGRIGRLLIVLMLLNDGLLTQPLLYPSFYFKKHHMEYYERLDKVRTQGDFEGWITYYLKAIRECAFDAHRRIVEIEALRQTIIEVIQTDSRFTRMRDTATKVLDILFLQPIVGASEISKGIGKAYNTATNVMKHFVELGFVMETKMHKRNKLYRFQPYLALLEE